MVPSSSSDSALSARRARALLLLLVVSSLAVYAWVAMPDPGPGRAWDERYSLQDVEGILRTGSLRPAFAWYPRLAHLPQAAVLGASEWLHDSTGNERFAVLEPEKGLRPAAYRLSRWMTALYGAACLALTFGIGRRLFSNEVGLLAALFLAVSPWQIRAASIYKPDALLMLLTLLTFLWCLRAEKRGTLGSHVLAGIGVGLASSTKQTGAFASIPLVAATLFRFRDFGRWKGLIAAGAVSVLVFLILHPYPDLLERYVGMGQRYVQWAEATDAGDLPSTPVFAVRLLFAPTWHGWLVGTAALLGFFGLLARLWRLRTDEDGRGPLAMFLAFAPGFVFACAAVSPFPKTNILLPTLPFTAIMAAWMSWTAWRWTAGRLSPAGRRVVFWPALAALVFLLVKPTAAYVYGEAVPETTYDRAALAAIRLASFPGQRSAVYESAFATRWARPDGTQVLARREDDLTARTRRELDLFDFEVFPESRLHRPDGASYLERLSRLTGTRLVIVEPAPFRLRGPRLMVVAHPWHPRGEPVSFEWTTPRRRGSNRVRGVLAGEITRGEPVSLDARLSRRQNERCSLSFDDHEVVLTPYRVQGDDVDWMTERFLFSPSFARARLECESAADLEPRPVVTLWRWSRSPDDVDLRQ